MVRGPNGENKRRYIEDQTKQEVQMIVLYDIFKLLILQSVTIEERSSTKRRRNPTELLDVRIYKNAIIQIQTISAMFTLSYMSQQLVLRVISRAHGHNSD